MNFFGKNSMIKLMELIKSTFSNVLRCKGDSEFSPSGGLNDADLFKGHQMSEFVMKGTDPIEPILPILPKDADRLEGHDAGYFASKNELDAEVSRAKSAENAINNSLTFNKGDATSGYFICSAYTNNAKYLRILMPLPKEINTSVTSVTFNCTSATIIGGGTQGTDVLAGKTLTGTIYRNGVYFVDNTNLSTIPGFQSVSIILVGTLQFS